SRRRCQASARRMRARAARARVPRAAPGHRRLRRRGHRGTCRTPRAQRPRQRGSHQAVRRTQARGTRARPRRTRRSPRVPEARDASLSSFALGPDGPSIVPGMATLTWLGHASFRLDTDDGKRIYIDPWLHGNPKTPESELDPERCDVIAITHAHGDHLGDAVDISKKFPDAEIVAMVGLKPWLGAQGAHVGDLPGLDKSGKQAVH